MIKVGDKVVVHTKDILPNICSWTNTQIDWDDLKLSIYQTYVNPDAKHLKCIVTEVHTHWFFGLFKLKEPIYVVQVDGNPDYEFRTHKVKPAMTYQEYILTQMLYDLKNKPSK